MTLHNQALYFTTTDSPVGHLTLVASDAGVRAILWEAEGEHVRVRFATAGAVEQPDHPVLTDAVGQLGQYFAGERREFDLPLDTVGTEFQRSAWTALRTIPFGATVSYGEQARRLGNPKAVRAVGTANGRNPVSIVVPCHRVVGSDGSLTGFAAGLETKAWLLDHERDVLARTR